jgi:hypothetical protein
MLLARSPRLLLFGAALSTAVPGGLQASRRVPPASSSSTNCPQSSDYPCPPPQDTPSAEHGSHRGHSALPWVIGLVALGAGVAAATSKGRFDSEDELDKNGPRLSSKILFGRFAAEGYVRGGWPLVFNIDAAPDATVYLQLVVDGVEDRLLPQHTLLSSAGASMPVTATAVAADAEVAAHGRYLRFNLPEIPELSKVRRAWVTLIALKDGKPAPLSVYALGCGHEAVGSVALTVDAFGPSPLSNSQEPRAANYLIRFHNKVLFPRLSAQIFQERAVSEGGFKRKMVDSFDLLPLRRSASTPTISGSWPRPGSRFPDRGSYDMQVSTFVPHGAWVLGFSPTAVAVR